MANLVIFLSVVDTSEKKNQNKINQIQQVNFNLQPNTNQIQFFFFTIILIICEYSLHTLCCPQVKESVYTFINNYTFSESLYPTFPNDLQGLSKYGVHRLALNNIHFQNFKKTKVSLLLNMWSSKSSLIFFSFLKCCNFPWPVLPADRSNSSYLCASVGTEANF